jgi:hypothetical protein
MKSPLRASIVRGHPSCSLENGWIGACKQPVLIGSLRDNLPYSLGRAGQGFAGLT